VRLDDVRARCLGFTPAALEALDLDGPE